MGQISPDGSPVEVYRRVPPGETPWLIAGAVPPGGTILELGCGPGRITRPLVAMGYSFTAVDNSTEMLAHIDNAEPIFADIYELDLGRRFDAVVAGSHLINSPKQSQRLDLLGICSAHVSDGGCVLIERYDPEWAASPRDSEGIAGPVTVVFELLEHDGDRFRGRSTYMLSGDVWRQEFTAANVTDAMLSEEAAATGLRLAEFLNARRTWACLEPGDPTAPLPAEAMNRSDWQGARTRAPIRGESGPPPTRRA